MREYRYLPVVRLGCDFFRENVGVLRLNIGEDFITGIQPYAQVDKFTSLTAERIEMFVLEPF